MIDDIERVQKARVVAKGHSSAVIEPAIKGYSRYDTENLYGRLPPNGEGRIIATQTFSEGFELGISAIVSLRGDKCEIGTLHFIVEKKGYEAKDQKVSSVVFQPGVKLSFNFSFSFFYQDNWHQVASGELTVLLNSEPEA